MRTFLEGETYYVEDEPGLWAIIRPSKTIHEHSYNGNQWILCGPAISNMNKNEWSPESMLFARRDGACTYPWHFDYGVSVVKRYTRKATPDEKAMMDRAIETEDALTYEEIRDIRINSLLE